MPCRAITGLYPAARVGRSVTAKKGSFIMNVYGGGYVSNSAKLITGVTKKKKVIFCRHTNLRKPRLLCLYLITVFFLYNLMSPTQIEQLQMIKMKDAAGFIAALDQVNYYLPLTNLRILLHCTQFCNYHSPSTNTLLIERRIHPEGTESLRC